MERILQDKFPEMQDCLSPLMNCVAILFPILILNILSIL